MGYDPAFGARPLQRTVQSMVQSPLAKMMLAGEIKEGDRVKVDFSGEELGFEPVGKVETEEKTKTATA